MPSSGSGGHVGPQPVDASVDSRSPTTLHAVTAAARRRRRGTRRTTSANVGQHDLGHRFEPRPRVEPDGQQLAHLGEQVEPRVRALRLGGEVRPLEHEHDPVGERLDQLDVVRLVHAARLRRVVEEEQADDVVADVQRRDDRRPHVEPLGELELLGMLGERGPHLVGDVR